MDLVDLISNESDKEREDDMSSLIVRFTARMRKRAASAQRRLPPTSKGQGDKRPKWSGPNEEAKKSSVVIIMDSPERALDALPTLEGATQDASKEACASLEDGAPTGGPPNADQAVSEAPATERTIGPPL